MKTVNFNNEKVIPSKIICVGRNYIAHAKELGNPVPSEPVIFIKPNSAIASELCAGQDETNHYEGELCFIINDSKLAGVGFGIDLTKRETQQQLKKNGLPWERAKAFNNSAIFSDFVTLDNININTLSLLLTINGDTVQHASVDMMLFKPVDLLNNITEFLSLEDGDIIMTGTPEGVGPVVLSDCFTGSVASDGKRLVTGSWHAI